MTTTTTTTTKKNSGLHPALIALAVIGALGFLGTVAFVGWALFSWPSGDLASQTQIELRFEMQGPLQKQVQRRADHIAEAAGERGAKVVSARAFVDDNDDVLVFELADDESVGIVADSIAREATDLALMQRAERTLKYRLSREWRELWTREAMDAALKTLAARVEDMDGTVTRRGETSIAVTVDAGDRAVDDITTLLTRTARLEMIMVDDAASPALQALQLPPGVERVQEGYQKRDGTPVADEFLRFPPSLAPALQPLLPSNARMGKEWSGDTWRTWLVEGKAVLGNDDIETATVAMGSPDQPYPYVIIEMTPEGKARFAEATTKNVGRRLAIILEDVVDSAPVINEPITGGTAQITMGGQRSHEAMLRDASQLAATLKAGALLAPLRVVSVRGPGTF